RSGLHAFPTRRSSDLRVVRYGMAVETILREAVDGRADLLVVGSHGRGWAERALVGSVTERLLSYLPTSLLVVPTVATAKVEVPRSEEHTSKLQSPCNL